MFSVIRPPTFPKSLSTSTKDYRASDVVEVLQHIFFSKCYLCERKGFPDVNIEHRDPHEGDLSKNLIGLIFSMLAFDVIALKLIYTRIF